MESTIALHHIITRGIERQPIFKNDADGDYSLKRLSKGINEGSFACKVTFSLTAFRSSLMQLRASFAAVAL